VTLDIDTVADELYGLLPGEFTSTRDARAAEARRSGERELAAAIKALKRPTSGAWLVNLLARSDREQIATLLDLGAAMREAQEQLVGDELRRLSQQRRQVVSALGQSARERARDVGQPVSEEAGRELEATLEAALADPAAGEAVRSGRLTTALKPSGFGAPGRADTAASPPAKAGAGGGGKQSGRSRIPRQDDNEAKRQLQAAAAQALREAELAATAARSTATELAAQASEATRECSRLRELISDVAAQLEHLKAEETVAVKQSREAERAREAGDRAARAAEHRADQLRLSKSRLGD
jgi:hypothetical protein